MKKYNTIIIDNHFGQIRLNKNLNNNNIHKKNKLVKPI